MINRRLNTLESKKQNLLRQNAQVRHARSNSHESVAMSQAQEMMIRHSINESGHTNIDPFLPGENTITSMPANICFIMGSTCLQTDFIYETFILQATLTTERRVQTVDWAWAATST